MASTVKCQSCGHSFPRTIRLCPSCGGKSFSSADSQFGQASQPVPLPNPPSTQAQPSSTTQQFNGQRVTHVQRRWGLVVVCTLLALLSLLGGTSGATYGAFWFYMAYLSHKGDLSSLYQWVKWVLIFNLAVGLGFVLFAGKDTLLLMGLNSVLELVIALGIPALIKVALLAYLGVQLKSSRNSP